MSFVLDALKISEQRRSRLRRRVYAHPPRPRRAGRARQWLMVPGALAAIALVFLVWRLAAPLPEPLPAPAPGTTDRDSAAVLREQAPKSFGPPSEPAGRGGKRESPGSVDSARVADQAGPVPRPPGPATAPGAGQDNPGPDFDPEQETDERVVTAAPPGWPALSLQMLFFSEEENRSFVQVNGKTYRAGERLGAGPRVLGISNAGVTLEYRRQRVLLGMER